MIKLSRRVMARYAADQLLAGKPVKHLANELVAVLTMQKSQAQLEQLMADIQAELENRGQLAIVKATVAYALTPELKAEIESAVKLATSVKHVSLDETVDKTMLGGLRLETASWVWDQSLKTKLAKLREVA